MRVAAFRIRNFRSIVDTGWVDLSRDGITGLVGQNEAGKTSVLRAIFAFDDGEVTADDQRSDDSLPEVYLSFELDQLPSKLMDHVELPDAIDARITESGGRINLLRSWDKDLQAMDHILDPGQKLAETLFAEDDAERAGETYVGPISGRQFAKEFWHFTPEFTLFSDEASLLPSHIDLADLRKPNSEAEGLQAVKNFIELAGLVVGDLGDPKKQRPEERRLRDASQHITADFQSFWEQTVGRENRVSFECVLKRYDPASGKAGEPYLEFLVNDNREKLHLKQRSKGLQWFLSFYLQLRASAKNNEKGTTTQTLFLIDEPGGSLHAKAQANVLKVLEDLKQNIQVIYATHSPFLINVEELGRLLIAERSDNEDEGSPTVVKDVHRFSGDHVDALFPIYAAIGADLSHQRIVEKTDNVLLEEMSAYHYLRAFWLLTGEKATAHFVPGSGATTTAPMFANLFTGWGLRYVVLVDNDDQGKRTIRKIKKHLFAGRDDLASNDLITLRVGETIEDVLTPEDFKHRVLLDPDLTYTESNGEYVKSARRPKGLLAAQFCAEVQKGSIGPKDLSPDSMKNIRTVVASITKALRTQKERRD
ncbi:MAG: ATP-dependent nuclease [Thermoleophilia bacterium]